MADWKAEWNHQLVLHEHLYGTDWYERWYGKQLSIVDQLSASLPSILMHEGIAKAVEAAEGIKEYLTELEAFFKSIRSITEDELQQLAKKAVQNHQWNPKDFLNQ